MNGLPLSVRVILIICLVALLAFASLVPGRLKSGGAGSVWIVAKTPVLMQKALHVCLYGLLAFLLVWTLDAVQSGTFRFLIPFIVAVGFGALMEWCQTKVPGRFGTLSDVALNAAGAGFGLLAAVYLL